MNSSSGVVIYVCDGCSTKTDRCWRQHDGGFHCPTCHDEDRSILAAQEVVLAMKRMVDAARWNRRCSSRENGSNQ